MIVLTDNLLMIPAYFFAAFRDGHFYYSLGFAEFPCYCCGFIVSLSTSISADLDIVRRYAYIWKAGSILSLVSLRCFDRRRLTGLLTLMQSIRSWIITLGLRIS